MSDRWLLVMGGLGFLLGMGMVGLAFYGGDYERLRARARARARRGYLR